MSYLENPFAPESKPDRHSQGRASVCGSAVSRDLHDHKAAEHT
jgi:hypothetical protein